MVRQGRSRGALGRNEWGCKKGWRQCMGERGMDRIRVEETRPARQGRVWAEDVKAPVLCASVGLCELVSVLGPFFLIFLFFFSFSFFFSF